MTPASDQDVFAAIDGTWPAARTWREGPWTLRDGQGGGKRVSAASAEGPVDDPDIAAAETAMRAIGQDPLFMIRPGDAALDAALARRGYTVIDPVTVYACDAALLTDLPIPRVTILRVWEPLAMMREIWAAGGIGPERVAVMMRVRGPRTGFLCRFRDKPAGTAFAAIHDGIAMVHAIEILPHQRRIGVGKWLMRAAAFWAVSEGAHTLSVVCTDANQGANALYASLGMRVVGHYHYRTPED